MHYNRVVDLSQIPMEHLLQEISRRSIQAVFAAHWRTAEGLQERFYGKGQYFQQFGLVNEAASAIECRDIEEFPNPSPIIFSQPVFIKKN